MTPEKQSATFPVICHKDQFMWRCLSCLALLSLNTPGPSAKAITRKSPSNMILPKLFYENTKLKTLPPLFKEQIMFFSKTTRPFTLIVIQKKKYLKIIL